MGFIHFADCPVWTKTGPCTCPRQWRIRKDRNPSNPAKGLYPWVVARRDSDGVYADMLRARTFDKARSLVCALDAAAANPSAYRRFEGCVRPW